MASGGEVGHHVDDSADPVPTTTKARLTPTARTIGPSV
jgi:hypothetical protein